jgi:hypothetical protein
MIVLSIVACLSTVGGIYGSAILKSYAKAAASNDKNDKVTLIRTRMVSVPIMSDGEVLGYVVTRLKFNASLDELTGSSIKPEPFVADEAFKLIYETGPKEVRAGRKLALRKLTSNIAEGVNKRLGRDLIKNVFIDSWTYLSKQDMIRNNERSG